ncbi:MAG: DUF523 domain-containing protein [bacterium]|nr:DUF523 domain-containing protein [bacterium]
MNILVSACLIGIGCRYDGKSKVHPDAMKLLEKYTVIPYCPEVYGGLPTPRKPSEIRNNRVLMEDGTDVTAQFAKGAKEALRLAKLYDCQFAVLKERSPSCGTGYIYDGTFTGRLTDDDGLTAKLLKAAGIKVIGESEIPNVL